METVQKVATMLENFDADTQSFLDALPTPDKYEILALAITINNGYDDYEEAHCEALHKVSAQDLTKYLMDYKFLYCHLQDALRFGAKHFEVAWCNDEEEDEQDK